MCYAVSQSVEYVFVVLGYYVCAFHQEMCKVESSTDSESDISPRSSDTSTMVALCCLDRHTQMHAHTTTIHKYIFSFNSL